MEHVKHPAALCHILPASWRLEHYLQDVPVLALYSHTPGFNVHDGRPSSLLATIYPELHPDDPEAADKQWKGRIHPVRFNVDQQAPLTLKPWYIQQTRLTDIYNQLETALKTAVHNHRRAALPPPADYEPQRQELKSLLQNLCSEGSRYFQGRPQLP